MMIKFAWLVTYVHDTKISTYVTNMFTWRSASKFHRTIKRLISRLLDWV